MTRRRSPAPPVASTDADGAPICLACNSPSHELRGCSTQRAADLLAEQGRPMSAYEVRRRIASKETP